MTGHQSLSHLCHSASDMISSAELTDKHFWLHSPEELSRSLGCGLMGLSTVEAADRLTRYGPNSDAPPRLHNALRAILRRLLEPLSLILLVAGLVSMFT